MATTSSTPAQAPATTDAVISQAVLQQLQRDDHTANLPIAVDVFDRIVFVHGKVPNVGSVADLTALIGGVDDVAEVIDQLVIDDLDPALGLDPQEYMGPDTQEVVE